jgi:hypothetical protein
MRYYCTLFDYNYAHLGLAMCESLQARSTDYHIWILCLDERTYRALAALKLEHVSLVPISAVEAEDVLIARGNRTWQEYCWTLSAVFTDYLMTTEAHIDLLTYLDSDIYFFSDPEPIFRELASSSILIVPHRFPERLKHLEFNGKFNVQFVSFRRDEEGLTCLRTWRNQCVEWCYYRVEEHRMGDQKYLDAWPSLYSNVCILTNFGAGLALWNAEQYKIADENNRITVDGTPLIFYHFHRFKYLGWRTFFSGFGDYDMDDRLFSIYTSYVAAVVELKKRYRLPAAKVTMRQVAVAAYSGNIHAINNPVSIAIAKASGCLLRSIDSFARKIRRVFDL